MNKNETQKTDKETISKKDSLNQAYDPMVGHPKRKLILAVMCLSLIVTVLDNSILNVAIPTISETLKANDTDLIWIIDAYTIVFAGLLLTCGTLGDKFGRRLALQSGLFIFGAASFASSFASSPLQLTMGRAIMGIGGALIMPATLSIITNVFPPKERGKAIGVWAAFAGVGVAIGPLTGGFLLEHFWWGSVFMVNVPFVIIGIFANLVMVPESKHEDSTKLDIVGAVLSVIGLSSLLYAIIFGAEESFARTNVLTAFAIAFVTIVVFFIWESKNDHAMLELSFFKDKRFSSGALSITLLFFAMFGMSFLLSQYFQSVLGYSALKTGVAFIPFALGMIVSAPSSDKLSAKYGTKSTVITGLVLVTIALFSMSTLEVNSSYLYAMWMMVTMSVGTGLTMAPATSGLAIVGSIFSNFYRSALSTNVKLSAFYSSLTSNGVPGEVKSKMTEAISGSIGQAKYIAETQPSKVASKVIIDASRESFVNGLHAGVIAAGIATLIAIVIAFILMPQNSLTDSQHAGEIH